MKKAIIAILMTAFVLLTTHVFAVTEEEVNANKVNPMAQELNKFIVQITSIGEGLGYCSGVVISNTESEATILTCKHCVAPTHEMYVEDRSVISIHTLAREDLAYLIVNGHLENKEPANILKYNEFIGEKIYMLGKPGLTIEYYKEGVIKRYTNHWGFAQLDAIGGCSGTGIFNADMKLIGILWGGYTEGAEGGGLFTPGVGGIGISIFEPTDDIRYFLEQVKKDLK